MICPECGHESTGNFCSYCGAQLNQEDAPVRQTENGAPDGSIEIKYDAGHETGYEAAGADRDGKRGRSRRHLGRSGGKSSGKADGKSDTKALQRKDTMIKRQLEESAKREKLLGEQLKQLKQLREERPDREPEQRDRRMEAREKEPDYDDRGRGIDLGKAAAKGAVGMIVLASRLMQIFCCFLMVSMVFRLARSLWLHQEGLGLLANIVGERNYGLAVYVGFSGVTLFMGAVWCLWILTRKAAGGGVRLKTYDTGRGFLPFLICLAAVTAAGIAEPLIPSVAGTAEEILKGMRAALAAVNACHGTIVSGSLLGAALSLVRKLLRV